MSSKSNNRHVKAEKPSYISVGKYVSDIVGAYFRNSSDFLLLQKIRSQLDSGSCFVSDIICLQLDEKEMRFYPCGRKSRKISVPPNLSDFVKTQASKICSSGDPFDQLLVNAMWTKAIAESKGHYCEIDDTYWRYVSFKSTKIEDSYSLVFGYRLPKEGARNTWVDVNCPQNMLSLYSSGGVPIKGRTVGRELPGVAEKLELHSDFVMDL